MLSTPLPEYEVLALRVAGNPKRKARESFFFDACCMPPDAAMPLDYFFWIARSADRVVVIDTAFPEATALQRQRIMYRSVPDALRLVGVEPEAVRDVVLTHLHWDHAGHLDLFPNARIHLQHDELAYCTGPAMAHHYLRKTYVLDDVLNAVRVLYGERLVLHRGVAQIAPGFTAHQVGGHTPGSQVARIVTARGHVVLASDAAHFWINIRERRPFPIVHDLAAMLDAYTHIESLADGPDHVIPGHDPLVAQRFPKWKSDPHISCLHLAPSIAADPDCNECVP